MVDMRRCANKDTDSKGVDLVGSYIDWRKKQVSARMRGFGAHEAEYQ